MEKNKIYPPMYSKALASVTNFLEIRPLVRIFCYILYLEIGSEIDAKKRYFRRIKRNLQNLTPDILHRGVQP